MLQQQIHWWLGGVQERRNATGYVHFCAPVERLDGGVCSEPFGGQGLSLLEMNLHLFPMKEHSIVVYWGDCSWNMSRFICLSLQRGCMLFERCIRSS